MQNLLDTIKKYFSSVYADSKTLNEAMEILNKTYSDITNNFICLV